MTIPFLSPVNSNVERWLRKTLMVTRKRCHGVLGAYFIPPATPEPSNLLEFRVMDEQVLQGHLKKMSQGELMKLCNEHEAACESDASKSDMVRARAIPLFLPTHRVRESAYPKLREFLPNRRKAEWKLPCCWTELCQSLPFTFDRTEIMFERHCAVNLDSLNLARHLRIFKARTPVLEHARQQFKTWLRHHGLQPHLLDSFVDFLKHAWKLHLGFGAVQRLVHWLPYNCIIHHGDNHQYRIAPFLLNPI